MKENRYPITQIGIFKMLEAVIRRWEQQPNNTRVRFFPKAKMGKKSVRVIQVVHPLAGKGTPFHMTRLYIDNQTRLPIRVQQYGFPKKAGAQPPLTPRPRAPPRCGAATRCWPWRAAPRTARSSTSCC